MYQNTDNIMSASSNTLFLTWFTTCPRKHWVALQYLSIECLKYFLFIHLEETYIHRGHFSVVLDCAALHHQHISYVLSCNTPKESFDLLIHPGLPQTSIILCIQEGHLIIRLVAINFSPPGGQPSSRTGCAAIWLERLDWCCLGSRQPCSSLHIYFCDVNWQQC